MRLAVYVLLFTSFITAIAQDGYVVSLEGDTVRGEIKIYASTYYDEVQVKNDDNKNIFKAYQITSIQDDSETYEPISFQNRKVIAKLVQKGALSKYLVRPENEIRYITEVLYKDDEALIISNIGFRKRLIEYFKDCTVLTDGLEKKEISASDIDSIIETYNSNCAAYATQLPEVPTDFSDLKEFSQLINDITSRIEKGENVPGYLVDALKKYSEGSINNELQKLIDYLEN